jgi:hypothetical protein
MKLRQLILDKLNFLTSDKEKEMTSQHPHAQLIKAWADGAQIQWYDVNKKMWVDEVDVAPLWAPLIQYRIKPKTSDFIYKVKVVRSQRDGKVSLHYRRSRAVGSFKPNMEIEFSEDGKLVSAKVL